MAVKKVKKVRKPATKAKPKARPKAKPAPKAQKGLECRVCGYRVIVDGTCGCVEEHVLLCCGQPMAEK